MPGSGEQLHTGAEGRADRFAGKRYCGESCEAYGGGVAQDGLAGVGVVVARAKFADRGAGREEQIEVFEQGGHFGAEGVQALMQTLNSGGGNRGAVGHAFGDDRLEVIEVATMDCGGFAGYDGRVDLRAFIPEGCVEGVQLGSVLGEAFLPGFVGVEHGGFAVVKEVVADAADAECRGRWNRFDIEDGVGDKSGIAEVVEENTEGVEAWGEMVTARPEGFRVEDV